MYRASLRLSLAIIKTLWPFSLQPGLRVMEQSLVMLVLVNDGSKSLLSISSSKMAAAADSDHLRRTKRSFISFLSLFAVAVVDRVVTLF